MTVDEAIIALQKLPDRARKLAMLIDCPHCGHANEMSTIAEVVLVGNGEQEDATK